jgi:UDP-2,3-diacylglucosamine hydrolase
MRVAIFSDTHLGNKRGPRNILFEKALRALSSEPYKVEEIWLVGDIFDLMIGPYKFWKKMHADFFSVLKDVIAQGIRIKWFEGNHDFLLGPMLEDLGVKYFEGPSSFSVGSKKVFLGHGDEVDQNNKAYLKWRKTSRALAFRSLVKYCPELVAQKALLPIGENLSLRSRKRHYLDDRAFYQQLFRSFAQRKWSENFDIVVLGHSHVLDFYFSDTSPTKFYINLGSWFDKSFRFAFWEIDKEIKHELLHISSDGVIFKVDEQEINVKSVGLQT